jgi:hypothetical protein
MRVALARLAVCAAAVLCLTALATAAVPKGTLSGAEYRQLSRAMSELNRAVGARSIDWGKARAACREVGGGTPLLRTQRSGCLTSVTALAALAGFPPEQRRCSSQIKTTTSTTTTATETTTGATETITNPADAAAIQLLICMSPRYDALAQDAAALQRGAIADRQSALARRFSGSCLAALAPTPADLGKARLFASSSERLAADVKVLIRVTEGTAPSSDFNQARVDNDVRQFQDSASAVLDEHGQPRLSVCPHQ